MSGGMRAIRTANANLFKCLLVNFMRFLSKGSAGRVKRCTERCAEPLAQGNLKKKPAHRRVRSKRVMRQAADRRGQYCHPQSPHRLLAWPSCMLRDSPVAIVLDEKDHKVLHKPAGITRSNRTLRSSGSPTQLRIRATLQRVRSKRFSVAW